MSAIPPGVPDPIDGAVLRTRAGLATIEQFAEVASTMDRARLVARDPAARLPAAVVADRQTLGRGRRGAGWWQPPGSLVLSLVVDARALGSPVPRPTWSLACGVALAEALEALLPGIELRVRWPNDVYAADRKLAGIIVESVAGDRAIFGIGVNTTGHAVDAPPAIRHRVATVPDLVGHFLPRGPLLEELVPRLVGLLGDLARDPGALVARYRPRCGLVGRDVTVFQAVERRAESAAPTGPAGRTLSGRCLGIDSDGALVVETVAGRLHLATGSLSGPGDEWPGDGAGANGR